MKKWYLSKTILVAMAMEALAQVTLHMEEVQEAIASHTNTDAGLAFAIAFPMVMVGMRFITTKPIEGVNKSVKYNREDQNDSDDRDGGGDSDNGVMDGVSETISDSAAEIRQSDPRIKEAILRDVTHRAKRSNRGKRRR